MREDLMDQGIMPVHLISADPEASIIFRTREKEPEHFTASTFFLPLPGASTPGTDANVPMRILNLDPLRKKARISVNGSGLVFFAHSEAQAMSLQNSASNNQASDSGALFQAPCTLEAEGTGPLWAVASSIDTSPQSAGVAASATAPVAGGVVASIPAAKLSNGTWVVTGSVYMDGTIVAGTDEDNMKLVANGATITNLLAPAVADNVVPFGPFYVNFVPPGGPTNISVQAVNNASAAVVYHASIVATPSPFDAIDNSLISIGVLQERRGA